MNVPIIILRRVINTENKNNDAKCITYLVFLAKSHPVLLFRSISEKIVSWKLQATKIIKSSISLLASTENTGINEIF